MTPTILTSEGTYFDFLDPESSEFSIESIAHALSHVCRFGGHSREFYSVAEHCVRMSYIVPAEHALIALMHEAGEPFCGDMPAPLKMLLPEYKAIEKRIEAAVLARFGLPAEFPPCIKQADRVMLATEQRDLMNCERGEVWMSLVGVEPLPAIIKPWCSRVAKSKFLQRYEALASDRAGLPIRRAHAQPVEAH